jgi:hypothetical protein
MECCLSVHFATHMSRPPSTIPIASHTRHHDDPGNRDGRNTAFPTRLVLGLGVLVTFGSILPLYGDRLMRCCFHTAGSVATLHDEMRLMVFHSL